MPWFFLSSRERLVGCLTIFNFSFSFHTFHGSIIFISYFFVFIIIFMRQANNQKDLTRNSCLAITPQDWAWFLGSSGTSMSAHLSFILVPPKEEITMRALSFNLRPSIHYPARHPSSPRPKLRSCKPINQCLGGHDHILRVGSCDWGKRKMKLLLIQLAYDVSFLVFLVWSRMPGNQEMEM